MTARRARHSVHATLKANSRVNSFQHGLTSLQVLPAAQQPEYDALAAGFVEHFQPSGLEEKRLVQILTHAEWNQRRYRALEEVRRRSR
jgi:hypothetical protein